ncbi:E3 ubiquitin-protein ligase DTX4 isoform X2 [Strongylocentrotus purpuratus]|uniref:E3 ubiquitin-protein ligase n=1 Tax=Strongylocentrotus purpuratus TaxID=7668 RepID=A0A7M7STX5_STRPU|nr:E3 ubiquitin-protein ligase DTX4 isoform X2 [Strongylocentrotus purpuratus]
MTACAQSSGSPSLTDCSASGTANCSPMNEDQNKMDEDDVVVWEWFSDHGRWRAYDPSVVVELEAAHGRQATLALGNVDPALSSYEIDFTAMQQYRTTSGNARPIRRRQLPGSSPAGQGVEWQWEDNSGWIQYDLDTSTIVEDAYKQNLPSIDLSKTKCHLPYIIDYTQMMQVRRTSGFKRKLRRVVLVETYPKVTNVPSLSEVSSASGSPELSAVLEVDPGADASIKENDNANVTLESCQIEMTGDVAGELLSEAVELSRPTSLSISEPIKETDDEISPSPATTTTTPNVPQVVEPPSTGTATQRAGKRSHGKRSSSRKAVAATRDVQATVAWTSPGDPDVASTSSAGSSTGSTGRSSLPRSVSVPASMAAGQSSEGSKHHATASPVQSSSGLGMPPLTQSATMSHLAAAAAATTSRMRKSHSTPCTIQTRTANAAGARLSPVMTALPIKLVPVRTPIYSPPNSGGIRPVEGVKPRKKKRKISLRGQTAEEVISKYVEKEESPPDEECPICFEKLCNVSHYNEDEEEGDSVLKLERCRHFFHQSCLYAMYNSGPKDGSIQCPTCKAIYGVKCGNQPPGSMDYHVIPHSLPGFPSCGTIRIIYNIPPGTQGPEHPSPGRRYSSRGFPRMCYLPDNEISRKILRLLIIAWERRLIFTIGTSVTTGEPNTVVWNEIHHKTEFGSNVTGHGFPDPNYFTNILGELASQGVTEDCLDDY